MPPALAAADATEPAEKRAGAFRTISEVAGDLDVPQHVLRFWETRFGQIRPLKRAGGRRYYRPEDVDLVAGIRHLLHVRRYTIAGAQRVLKENGVRFVQAVGRGEAVAAAPALREAEGPPDASADTPPARGGGEVADRATLEDVLGELRACRALIAGLCTPPDDA